MKVRIAHAVLACLGAALMLAAPFAANAAELSTSGRALKPGQFNPANETVELFDAVKKGQLEVKMVHKDVAQGKVFITNKTGKPVNVKLPDAFVGVHVLAQGMGGMGGMGGGGGGAQMSGGGMGGGVSMSDDLDWEQLLKIHRAESEERLATMEAALLDLERNPSSPDAIESLRRDAHRNAQRRTC